MTMTIDATAGITFPDGTQQAKSAVGQAFSAYLPSVTTVTNATRTKIAASTEEFDTGNVYDNTTNYRFQPTVPGYYEIKTNVEAGGTTTSVAFVIACIYKNGAEAARATTAKDVCAVLCSKLIYLNGTTDYVEGYGQINATTPQFQGGATSTYFQGFLARAA